MATYAITSCAHASPYQTVGADLTEASVGVAEVIGSGELERLTPHLLPGSSFMEPDGSIHQETRCFFDWTAGCSTKPTATRAIASSDHFRYYYHVSEDVVIVSYIDSRRRNDFYEDPDAFLQQSYLQSYFSCRFVFDGTRWALDDSVCFSESEGPFEPEPDV